MADYAPDSVPSTPDEYVDSSSEASTPLDPPGSSTVDTTPAFSTTSSSTSPFASEPPRRVPSLRTVSDPQSAKLLSSTSSLNGTLQSARRLAPSAGGLPVDIMQKARALQQQRMGSRPNLSTQSTGMAGHGLGAGASYPPAMNMNMGGVMPGGVPGHLRLPPGMGGMGGMGRPSPPGFKSAPAVPNLKKASLSERRAMKLGGLPGSPQTGAPKLSDLHDGAEEQRPSINGEGRGSNMNDFKKYIDTEKGWITFEGAATITRTGVNFANGKTFSISLDEIETLDELGKGNYGTVYKVRHAKPAVPRFGQGLSHFRKQNAAEHDDDDDDTSASDPAAPPDGSSEGASKRSTTGVIMAMKELRLELDESKFATVLKELVILHECVSPYVIDFYGAFFQEGAVYMCIEYMDGGSIDKLYAGGIPEAVLRKITYATIMGLKSLKEDHNIIHRDVKPTNILVNTKGQVKICDFGVSGNLVASIAKTNIGCQSYMAPERISGGGMSAAGAAGGTYSVQSDIWSLGLTVIECAMGRYPYPPEVSSTIFSQLSVSLAYEAHPGGWLCHANSIGARPSSKAIPPTSRPPVSPQLRRTLCARVSTRYRPSGTRTRCCCCTRGSRRSTGPRPSPRTPRARPRRPTTAWPTLRAV